MKDFVSNSIKVAERIETGETLNGSVRIVTNCFCLTWNSLISAHYHVQVLTILSITNCVPPFDNDYSSRRTDHFLHAPAFAVLVPRRPGRFRIEHQPTFYGCTYSQQRNRDKHAGGLSYVLG